jgi:imidazolonepropionase
MKKLLGPFKQIICMTHLPLKGPIEDAELRVVQNGGIIINGEKIVETGDFEILHKRNTIPVEEITDNAILLPGMVDAHTHICYAGSRALDYSRKIEGSSYQEILAAGGGIHETVNKTRNATFEDLKCQTSKRVARHFYSGVTTMEAKSGYGLSYIDEIKMLEVIAAIDQTAAADLIPTCLAAHVKPVEFEDNKVYLEFILSDILPVVKERGLCNRVDIFVEDNAFSPQEAVTFLIKARALGFSLTVHADQFTRGGSRVAAATGAVSADHLEASGLDEIRALVGNEVTAVVLPGASIGLAMPFAPARKILDEGACLVIASDWNPGSAPMGDLLIEAALLSNSEKLSFAETFAGITFRAAHTLDLSDRGSICPGKVADLIAFPTDDYREILYNQGMLKPDMIWKNGDLNSKKHQ